MGIVRRIGGRAGDATRLHYLLDDREVWLDTDIGIQNGLCIGVGRTLREALLDAQEELRGRLADCAVALAGDSR